MLDFSDDECPLLLERYDRCRWLRGGDDAVVYEVIHRHDVDSTENDEGDEEPEKFAAKMIKDGRYGDREARIMNTLRDCSGVAQIEWVMRQPESCSCWGSIIMELYGPSLWYYRKERSLWPVVEREVAILVRKLAETLQRIHSKGVVHRDIKLENILFYQHARLTSDVVIGDFGVATDNEAEMSEYCGTEQYMAPEMFRMNNIEIDHEEPNKKITTAVDVWGLGLIAYQLLGAELDIDGLRDWGEFQWPAGISDDAKDLVSSMLERDPDSRCTLDTVLKHPWIVQHTVKKPMPRRCGAKRSLPGLTSAEMGVKKKLAT